MLSTRPPYEPYSTPELFRSPPRTETVLLAEDEDDVRHMLRLLLETTGCRVLEARNGSQAVRHCQSHGGPIHLLLTDVLVVPVGGRHLAEQVAQLRPSVRVLCMSGYPREMLVAEGLLDPRTQFLQKPFTTAVLKQKLREMFDE